MEKQRTAHPLTFRIHGAKKVKEDLMVCEEMFVCVMNYCATLVHIQASAYLPQQTKGLFKLLNTKTVSYFSLCRYYSLSEKHVMYTCPEAHRGLLYFFHPQFNGKYHLSRI